MAPGSARRLGSQRGAVSSSGCRRKGARGTSTFIPTSRPRPFAVTPHLPQVRTHRPLRPRWSPRSLPPAASGPGPSEDPAHRARVCTATHRWDVVMVLAFRDWVTWQAFFNSDSRNSSRARARSVKENPAGAAQAAPRPHGPRPGQPRQDTDDDGHRRRHLPNFLVRLHDLLDPRLRRGQRARTPSLLDQKTAPGKARGSPWRKGAGGAEVGRVGRGRGVGAQNTARRPPPSGAWARASREPGPLLTNPTTCSPAGTARCTSSSCSASPGLSPRRAQRRRPQPPGPGPAHRPPARPPRFPRVLVPPAPPRRSPLGPSAAGGDTALRAQCPPSEPPRRCASSPGSTAAPAGPPARRANVSHALLARHAPISHGPASEVTPVPPLPGRPRPLPERPRPLPGRPRPAARQLRPEGPALRCACR